MPQSLTAVASSLENEIKSLFGSDPSVSATTLADLRKAAESLERDPQFHAEYLKGKFVTSIIEAMDEKGMNQSMVAKKWGRSRQYLNKVLKEDKRVNFTFETAVELAMIVKRKLEIALIDMDESVFVIRCPKPARDVTLSTFATEQGLPTSASRLAFSRSICDFTCKQYEPAHSSAREVYEATEQLPA